MGSTTYWLGYMYTLDSTSTGKNKAVRVQYHGLTTIVFFSDGTKSVVRCGDDYYSRSDGVAFAIAFKAFNGTKTQWKKVLEKDVMNALGNVYSLPIIEKFQAYKDAIEFVGSKRDFDELVSKGVETWSVAEDIENTRKRKSKN